MITQTVSDRKPSQPDIGADVHLATLQCCVRSQVNGIGGLTAVVLVDEHWVFCYVKTRGIPVKKHMAVVRKVTLPKITVLKSHIRSTDVPANDDLSGWNPLVEFIHVLGKLHVHSHLLSKTEWQDSNINGTYDYTLYYIERRVIYIYDLTLYCMNLTDE